MPALGDVVVSARNVEKYFGNLHVLRGVDLDVRQHETIMIIGRSGSGKTTFLRCLNFLEEPSAGVVEIADASVEASPMGSRSRQHRELIRHTRAQDADKAAETITRHVEGSARHILEQMSALDPRRAG